MPGVFSIAKKKKRQARALERADEGSASSDMPTDGELSEAPSFRDDDSLRSGSESEDEDAAIDDDDMEKDDEEFEELEENMENDADDEDDAPTNTAAKKKKNSKNGNMNSNVDVEIREPARWAEKLTLTATKALPAELNPNDDPKREEIFAQQAIVSIQRGVKLLAAGGVTWRRPADFYAQMYKSDEHMNKIKTQIEKSRDNILSKAQRRANKTNKKFGKEVQADALREKAKSKRAMAGQISAWRKTQGRTDKGLSSALNGAGEDEDGGGARGSDPKADRRAKYGGKGKQYASGPQGPGAGKKKMSKQKRPGKSTRRK